MVLFTLVDWIGPAPAGEPTLQTLIEQRFPTTRNSNVRTGAARLSVSLLESGSSDLTVLWFEVAGTRFVRRSSFRDENALGMIFCGPFIVTLEEILARASTTGGLAQPDFQKALPGIVLARLRVSAKLSPEGRVFTIRFGECHGEISSIMNWDQTRKLGVDERVDRLAAETLQQVFLPLMDLSKQIEVALPAKNEAVGSGVLEGLKAAKKRIDELEIYYDWLTDLVGGKVQQPKRRTTEILATLSEF